MKLGRKRRWLATLPGAGLLVLFFAGSVHAGLLAHWSLDEGSGTTAEDSIGGNTGTLVDMSAANWSTDTPSGSGTSLSFDASPQHVTLDTQIFLRDTDAFSLSIWYRGTDTGTSGDGGFGIWGKTLLGRDDMDIYANFGLSDGYAVYSHFTSFPWVPESSNTFVSDGTWHQIVFVNRSDQTGSLYIDGVLDNGGFSTAIGNDIYSFRIDGFMRGYEGVTTTGTIDDVRIYDHSLSASEVSILFHSATSLPLMGQGAWIVLATSMLCTGLLWMPGTAGRSRVFSLRTKAG